MNRDEKLTRVVGQPPARFRENGRAGVSPSEPGGGTWVSLNDAGVTMALINWYAVKTRVAASQPMSRGEVVRATRGAGNAAAVDAILATLPRERINPFRLIGAFPSSREIFEWR
ncbi:MAG: NRDE family protein, partial [Verrucomicrobiota bacterium]